METFIKLYPLILSSILAVEQILGARNGKTKRALVLESVQAGAQITGQVGAALDNPSTIAIGGLIDRTVQVLNDSGLFQTTEQKDTAAAVKSDAGTELSELEALRRQSGLLRRKDLYL